MTQENKPLVYCPFCNVQVIKRGDVLKGLDECRNHHIYPAKFSLSETDVAETRLSVITLRIPKVFHVLIRELAKDARVSMNVACVDGMMAWVKATQEQLAADGKPYTTMQSRHKVIEKPAPLSMPADPKYPIDQEALNAGTIPCQKDPTKFEI